jgi:hypothetical protein
MDVKGPLRKGTLLHFTAQQWKQAIARIPEGKQLPKQGLRLEAYPIPGEDVLVEPICVSGPCEICRARTRPGPEGPISFDCACRRDPRCPEDRLPPPGQSASACSLVIHRTGGFIRIGCQDQGCTSARGCRLQFVRSGFRYVLTCVCA